MPQKPSPGLWLVSSGPERLTFRKPRWLRVLTGFATTLFVKMLYDFVAAANHNLTAIIPFSLLCGMLILTFSYMAGPDEVEFDLNRRTYRHRTGLFWLPLCYAGSFRDIASFHIQASSQKSRRRIYWLTVILDRPNRFLPFRNVFTDCPCLGEFSSFAEAERYAQEIAERLDVPPKPSR